MTLGGIRPLCGLVSLTLVGSVHFVVIILVARTQHGLECSFIRFKAVEKDTKRAIVARVCSYKKPRTIKRLVSASRNN